MRNALRLVGLFGLLALCSGRRLQAQSTSHAGGGLTYTVSAVVRSFVRVVTPVVDARTGIPGTPRVITNDPALRASLAAGLRSEVLAPEVIANLTSGRQSGGAESRGGAELAGPVTVRYTIVTP